MRLKFDDCATCAFRRRRAVCADCDMGELYEDEDRPGVDAVFSDPVTRFGESVIADDETETPQFDPERFAEEFGGEDEEQSDSDA